MRLRFAFEVFCKAIALQNVQSAIALTLSQQAIALWECNFEGMGY